MPDETAKPKTPRYAVDRFLVSGSRKEPDAPPIYTIQGLWDDEMRVLIGCDRTTLEMLHMEVVSALGMLLGTDTQDVSPLPAPPFRRTDEPG